MSHRLILYWRDCREENGLTSKHCSALDAGLKRMKYARKDLVLPFRTAAGFGIQGGIYDQYIYVETLRCALPEDVAFAFNRTSSFSGRKVFFRMREDPALRTLIFSSIATRHSTRLDSTSLGGEMIGGRRRLLDGK
jgi:hypothetical protein